MECRRSKCETKFRVVRLDPDEFRTAAARRGERTAIDESAFDLRISPHAENGICNLRSFGLFDEVPALGEDVSG